MKPLPQPSNTFTQLTKPHELRRPLYGLTVHILTTYKREDIKLNRPKRILTKLLKPFHNNERDNANYELIVSVDDVIGSAFSKEFACKRVGLTDLQRRRVLPSP